MTPTTLRVALNNNASALGMLVMMDAAASARIIAHLGYDFLIVDMQHGAIDLSGLEAALAGTKGTSCTPIVRVHPRRPDQIELALDLGAHGVVVPMVNSADDARLATQACRYPPQGRRSVAALRNVLERGDDFMDCANDDVICIIQIEHIDAVNQIEQILDVEGIDMVLPGHVDLAMSMGHVMRYGSSVSNTVPEEVAQAIQRVEDACAARSIPVMPVTGTVQETQEANRKGQRIVCTNTDFHLFKAAVAQQLMASRDVLAAEPSV